MFSASERHVRGVEATGSSPVTSTISNSVPSGVPAGSHSNCFAKHTRRLKSSEVAFPNALLIVRRGRASFQLVNDQAWPIRFDIVPVAGASFTITRM